VQRLPLPIVLFPDEITLTEGGEGECAGTSPRLSALFTG